MLTLVAAHAGAQQPAPRADSATSDAISPALRRSAALSDTEPSGAAGVHDAKGNSTAPAPTSGTKATISPSPKNSVPLQPPPPGLDVQGRSREVLAHLSAVIRYYRGALPPIQKVGEPSDVLYREQTLADAKQLAQYAFESGRAEAVLLQNYARASGTARESSAEGEAQRMQSFRTALANRTQEIKAQQKDVETRLQHAKRGQIAALEQQREQLDGALDLNAAMSDALGRIVGISDAQGGTGLAGDIDRLERTAPELARGKDQPIVTPPLENLGSAQSTGVTSQAAVVFQLLGTRHAIESQMREADALHKQALELRAPLTQVVRQLVQTSQEVSQQQTQAMQDLSTTATKGQIAPSLNQQLLAERRTLDSVTATFKVLSTATVPLSQEIITLEQARVNLLTWRAAVDTEYSTVLRALLLRVFAIALALGVVFVLGEVWRRATVRYVHDLRRRRQLLVMRRVVIGFLSGLVVIIGFVSQFNSLATFAGFITAGLAVGLQTILLSVAAYFFIVGRYGVRVGDRITIAGVTGDVVDVGLVRLYIMELGGGSNELHPTGRIAVFSNAVLFQASTPLYKQMPGTDYAWRELTVKLAPGANYGTVSESLLSTVRSVYETYREKIESQHRVVESWMDAAIDPPAVESRVQLIDDGLQLWIRFPVDLHEAGAIDEQMARSLLRVLTEDAELKGALASQPLIKAVVKG